MHPHPPGCEREVSGLGAQGSIMDHDCVGLHDRDALGLLPATDPKFDRLTGLYRSGYVCG